MAKRERGRESAADMVRSLGLVLLIVGFVFFFARPPHSDAKRIRVVDPASDVAAFASSAPAGVAPKTMPAGWLSTVSDYEDGILRVGWNTPNKQYAEYAASTQPSVTFVADFTDHASRVGTVDVYGVTWQEYRKDK